MAGLTSEPLLPHETFNWQFLIELLTCAVLTVFFFFYFNRLIGTLVSYGIRAYTWHRYRAYIDIQALQISLLGGRIFFKDIRYHAHNETILVHGGHITWRYWLRNVKDAEIFATVDKTLPASSDRSSSASPSIERAEKAGIHTNKAQSCRIQVKVSGLEAFLYNRSPAYDFIKAAFSAAAEADNKSEHASGSSRDGGVDSSIRARRDDKKTNVKFASYESSPGSDKPATHAPAVPSRQDTGDLSSTAQPPAFLNIFPIRLDCTKGAIVIGNESTRCILTATFSKAEAEIDAGQSGPLDLYKQIFRLKFNHPVVQMRPNPDFRASQLQTAMQLKGLSDVSSQPVVSSKREKSRNYAAKAINIVRRLLPFSHGSLEQSGVFTLKRSRLSKTSGDDLPGLERWKGLSRYVDEGPDDRDEWDDVEYARSTTILDSPELDVRYYWDIPGLVTAYEIQDHTLDEHRVNHTDPPAYGLDIAVHGGLITYGPWADRQRVNFQSYFFPNTFTDATPTLPLKWGDTRIATQFKIFVSIEEETILRIPTREKSKDWRWKGKAKTTENTVEAKANDKKAKKHKGKATKGVKREKPTGSSNARPFAWVDLRAPVDSTISYTMDMVASEFGYVNKVEADIRRLDVFTSVNHGLVWSSNAISVSCKMPNSRIWNQLRQWEFSVITDDLDFYILRDHMFLITDLVNDWGSGPPSDFYTFVPFSYTLNLGFRAFNLYLNCNEGNLINSPSDLDDNNFIKLHGETLDCNITIPLENFRPAQNKISFDVEGSRGGLIMCMPPKNTLSSFIKEPKVAYLEELRIGGSYSYYLDTSPQLTDILFFDVRGDKLTLTLYGFFIRHFMKLKDNYFGDDMHFRTLEEYQADPHMTAHTRDPAEVAKSSNDLDVILHITAEQAGAMLPHNLYSAEKNIRIDIPYIKADLRVTNYYMDLMLDSSPISLSLGNGTADPENSMDIGGSTQLFIDSISVFGHRLFGLPPTEPTYVCNWDFQVGNVTGDCSCSFLVQLASGGRAFGFLFDDDENALPITNSPVLDDITFLRLKTGSLKIWAQVDTEAFLIRSDEVSLQFNDWATQSFSQRMNLFLPNVTIACVDSTSNSRRRSRVSKQEATETFAVFKTTLQMSMLGRKSHFYAERRKQQTHVRQQDQRTSRTPFLLISRPTVSENTPFMTPSAMPFPPVPSPLLELPYSDTSASSFSATTRSIRSSRSANSHSSASSGAGSSGSFSASIRRHYGSFRDPCTFDKDHASTRVQSPDGRDQAPIPFKLQANTRALETKSQGTASVAFSSALAVPMSPFDTVKLNTDQMPILEEVAPEPTPDDDMDLPLPEEDMSHTSFIISSPQGVSGFFKPKAVSAALALIQAMVPETPNDFLDKMQLSVASTLLDEGTGGEKRGNCTEVSLRLPQINLRFVHTGETIAASADLIDVSIQQMNVALRSKVPSTSTGVRTTCVRSTFASSRLTLGEQHGPSHHDTALHAKVGQTLFWMASGESRRLHGSSHNLEVAAFHKKAPYVVSCTDRLLPLIVDARQLATTIINKQEIALQALALHLTLIVGGVPDPPFLTRPTYAIRAARRHLRNEDSWKIISMFRNIYLSIDSDERQKVDDMLSRGQLRMPADARDQIIGSWNLWRTWDLGQVSRTEVVNHLFGPDQKEEEEVLTTNLPSILELRLNTIRVSLDPTADGSNDVTLEDVGLTLVTTPATSPSGLMLTDGKDPMDYTTIEVYTRSISIQLSWELCKIAEILPKAISSWGLRGTQIEPATRAKPPVSPVPAAHSFHAIIVAESATLRLRSPNLSSTSVAHSLSFSLVGEDRLSVDEGLSANATLHAKSSSFEISSQSRLLCQAGAEAPTFTVSCDRNISVPNGPNEWCVAGVTEGLSVVFREELHGFVELADAIVLSEVRDIKRLTDSFASRGSTRDVKSEPGTFPAITVGLVMHSFQIEVALLQSLRYVISGTSGRLSILPDLAQKLHLRADFDIGQHTHQFRGNVSRGADVVSEFEVPPINGDLRFYRRGKGNHIDLLTTIDNIEFQASALYDVLATLNRPEITRAADAAKADFQVVESHLAEIFPTYNTEASKSAAGQPSLTYKIHLAMKGVAVRARAPGASTSAQLAELVLQTRSISFKLANKTHDHDVVLPVPEFHVAIQQIGCEVILHTHGSRRRGGNVDIGISLRCSLHENASRREIRLKSHRLRINIFADTAPAIIDIVNHLQDKIKDLDLAEEDTYIRRLRQHKQRITISSADRLIKYEKDHASALITSYFLELGNMQVCWIVGNSVPAAKRDNIEDLVLSISRIALSADKRNLARLSFESMQLQLSPADHDKRKRSANSALLPEVVFNAAYSSRSGSRRLAFQAAGQPLDLRLSSNFPIPTSILQQSVAVAMRKFKAATAAWESTPTSSGGQRRNIFGDNRLSSFMIDADFAGAVVSLYHHEPAVEDGEKFPAATSPSSPRSVKQAGRYGAYLSKENAPSATLQTPGIALKVEYSTGKSQPTLNVEVRVSASSNTLDPTVVPVIKAISDSVQKVVREPDEQEPMATSWTSQKFFDQDGNISDPTTILGKTKLNFGLRILRQEFGLSCQPFARVVSNAQFNGIYLTINSVSSKELGHFLAATASLDNLSASVQHVYSRESTFSFNVESIELSLMNSKHVSDKAGISAILRVQPTRIMVNGRQLQDFLVFREIWVPEEMRGTSTSSAPSSAIEQHEYFARRYREATAAAFPWNATVIIASLSVEFNLGKAIGRTKLQLDDFWANSMKSSNWEQHLCVGARRVGIDSVGRLSGLVSLDDFKVRTWITWPDQDGTGRETPLVQASAGIGRLQVKASFDYQAFAVADITSFDFIMYNIREGGGRNDRLAVILDGAKVQAFITPATSAQLVALYQALERLVLDNQLAYAQSLKDIERQLARPKSTAGTPMEISQILKPAEDDSSMKTPISLHTDVVVTLGTINIGIFPSSFFDNQILMLAASDTQARFAVSLRDADKVIQSGLSMTLGQLSVALASTAHDHISGQKSLSDVGVEDIVMHALSAKGGTILRVPRVVATMRTWQSATSNRIDYIFKSTFEGKVDVGWNYNRISFIRNMWATHSRSLASRLGKPLGGDAINVTITTAEDNKSRELNGDGEDGRSKLGDTTASAAEAEQADSEATRRPSRGSEQDKITAVVNVPQSRYEYVALEPPIIETPQLRDMGEATPPLEWIGLQRDRLPNVTHQIVIVTLLELAKEVEDAYSAILGLS